MHTKTISAVFLIFVAVVGLAGSVVAHESGHITIGEEEAVKRGDQVVSLLWEQGKIEKSWASAVLDTAELKVTGLRQWHLVFQNDAASEPEKNRLFVFLTADGQLLGVNFTGKTR